MHPVLPFTIAGLLFGIGVYGVLVRRNAVLLLMAVELMLNAVNLVFVTADATIRAAAPQAGQSFTLFVIVLAAAEIGVGLALILQLYRLRRTVGVDDLPLGDGPPPPGPSTSPPPEPGASPEPGAVPDPDSAVGAARTGSAPRSDEAVEEPDAGGTGVAR
ncbi:NADH-quinone oxidoreductase subunit NuoK [Dactylosporangium sp. NPDC000244]|uniref:NADH-quinone oxidoreductase subunit NuoK n=1 Tax=Dactylosporangium sp. NPDC000244 TaxID=3154365 RepID=UPI0033346807